MTKQELEKPFEMNDPYNPENFVKGVLYMDLNRYGDLVISEVNGITCNQYIHATPKFYYPGGRDSPRNRTKLPEGDAIVYEKLDGTNILRFSYKDSMGKAFITYKTRLSPFLKKNMYQDFKALWDQMLEKYPIIKTYPPYPFLAYELYGFVNPIVVQYKHPLDIAYIYTIFKDMLYPPQKEYLEVPTPKIYFQGFVDEDTYQEFEKKVEEQYVKEKSIEGVMFYIQNLNDKPWEVYKCKSMSLLQDSTKAALSKNEIKTTAINAFEITTSMDDLFDNTWKLLLETFPEELLNYQKQMVVDVIDALKHQIAKEQEIMKVYKELALDIKKDKGSTMRTIMTHFNKNESATVYTTIMKYTN
jgi:ribosomal protein L17